MALTYWPKTLRVCGGFQKSESGLRPAGSHARDPAGWPGEAELRVLSEPQEVL